MSTQPLIAGAVLAALLLAGCNHAPPAPAGKTDTYTLRGVITAIPGAASPNGPIVLHHEPVNNFINVFGKIEPMDSMAMAFQVAPNVPWQKLKVGDKVSCQWQVNWTTDREQIVAIKKLPPDTTLNFGKAKSTSQPVSSRAPATSQP